MADPRPLSKAQRAAARARNKATQRDLAKQYGVAWARIRKNLDALSQRIEKARAAGETVNPAWLYQQDRLQGLQRQVYAEITQFTDFASRRITAEQLAAIEHGRGDAADLIRASLGSPPPGAGAFQPILPVVATESIVGRMGDGTPIARYMAESIGSTTWDAVRSTLTQGVIEGWNPRKTARIATQRSGLPLARSLVTARTETIRAYREASRQTYAANSVKKGGVVKGWYWEATLDRRTCSVCVASNGELHEPDDSLDSHPQCRCTQVPTTATWEELGFPDVPDTRVVVEDGSAWFARQSADLQRSVLGPGKYDLYSAGDLDLRDLIVRTRSPIWGPGRR
ncbi:MAG: phage head morphogenesis protein, partial [Gemmatimonadaceae bacterium]|nr:phage head morphogenesis protein [Gemmatimonadaceae bacterium]